MPICVTFLYLSATHVHAQTVQLPTYRVFSTNTTVSVPDGGAAFLGGNTVSRYGSNRVGVPLLGRVPGAGPVFQNRAIGVDRTANSSWVTARIIDLQEMDNAVLAAAHRRRAHSTREDDLAEVEAKAEFLTRNIGHTSTNRSISRSNAIQRQVGRPLDDSPIRLGKNSSARHD